MFKISNFFFLSNGQMVLGTISIRKNRD